MLYLNFLPDGALVESTQNGTAAIPLQLPDQAEQTLLPLLQSVEGSQALAALVICGIQAGERSLATGRKIGGKEPTDVAPSAVVE